MLPFGTTTLLAAACCVPAILSLISMWDKILKINWKRRFGDGSGSKLNELLPGTNAATPARMMNTEGRIRFYLSMVEIPVFGAAVIAILIVGERNLFSYRVRYQTEPMASIGKQHHLAYIPWFESRLILPRLLGQWAPMVGTGLAALGSLYSLLAADTQEEEHGSAFTTKHCNISHHQRSISHPHYGNKSEPVLTRPQAPHNERPVHELIRQHGFSEGIMIHRQTQHSTPSTSRRSTFPAIRGPVAAPAGSAMTEHPLRRTQTSASDADGNRRKVAGAFEWLGEKLGTPAPDAFDDSDFRNGPAANYPTVPAEEQRNRELPATLVLYNPHRDSQGNATPNSAMLRRQRSGAGGSAGGGSRVSVSGDVYSEPAPAEDIQYADPSGLDRSLVERPLARVDTLEVPRPVFRSSIAWNGSSGSASGI